MGVLYGVAPLDESVSDWLRDIDVSFPAQTSRNPTPNELREAIRCQHNVSTEELGPWPDGDWQISVQDATDPENGPWTLINAHSAVDPNLPCNLGFEKGSPQLIVSILHALSTATGPLVLIPDTGDLPVVVWPGRSLKETLDSWIFVRDV